MKQIVQYVSGGVTAVEEVPAPLVTDTQVLVAGRASLISAGTERYVVDLARKSLMQKALARPDHVKRVLQKIRQEGIAQTARQVRAKLDDAMPLGYSASGVVLAAGRQVQAFKPGDRVAVAAPHASVVVAGVNLCAAIPDGVSFEAAAYTSVAAIALQGVRLARLTLGESVFVIGLGLVGQIAVALLSAQGCRVYGMDPDASRVALARTMGLDEGATAPSRESLRQFAPAGVDAVLITASTDSNEPIELAADVCRPKGRIVLVGVAGLNLPRPPFYAKELEFTVSSSLGPGRGDPQYEEKGIDYPIGHARWTAKRNMEAALGLMRSGKLPVEQLTTHRFGIDDAAAAYELIARRTEPHLGILIHYPESDVASPLNRRVELRATPAKTGALGVSLVGAGNFARLVLMPALSRRSGVRMRGVCTAKGLSAVHTGQTHEFAFATTDIAEILRDDETTAVVIATRHDLHATLVIDALEAGKHVFVEKPLCITPDELARIAACVHELGPDAPLLFVGFNRRFSSTVRTLRNRFAGVTPLTVSYRFSVGELPPASWPHDMDVGGGRLVGEACHAIDTCAAIVDSPVVRVFADSAANAGGQPTDDRVFITLRHANGSISQVSYQAGGDRSGPTERIEVFGGGITAVAEGWDAIDIWSDSRHTRASGGKDKGHAAELDAFVDACLGGGASPMTWEHIYSSTWAALAAVHSLRTGLPIALDDPIS
ncbi:MAG TPA: bi-domain-containing oxidoreductase [Vicinamibacterales bacterium]|nr:bi-domain-containing oxidoreductase [Vicinamibacterales bacterium]